LFVVSDDAEVFGDAGLDVEFFESSEQVVNLDFTLSDLLTNCVSP
jgi:hypothetical protein